jgi:hypothetical protein
MKADFTTTPDGNGIILRAHSKEARAWLRDQDAELDLDGLELDVWKYSTVLVGWHGFAYFVIGEILDFGLTVEAVEPASAP